MKYRTEHEKDIAETYEYTADFLILSSVEKRCILDSAHKLMEVQQENKAILADASSHKKAEVA